ncbi:MAG: hypothetical protein K2X77_06560, partial [Candidatus Obscuribacterales bacterium]|nr:hypothetical protein [Candidatus Obscuribacterales bacterium]
MPDDNTEVQRPSDSGAEKNSVGAREESNAFQSERTEDLFKDRDTHSEKSESAQASERTEEQGAREKSVIDTAAAVKSGDAAGLEKGVKSAFEDAKGDTSKFKDFGDKLGEKLKDSGIKVDTKDSSITLDRDGKSVTYSMKDQLDMNSGKVSAEMKAESGNGQNPKDVIAGFADNKDKSAEKANDAHSPGNGQQGELTAPSNPEMKIRGIGKSAQVQRDVPVDASAAAEKKDPEQKDAPVAPEKKDPEQKDAPV